MFTKKKKEKKKMASEKNTPFFLLLLCFLIIISYSSSFVDGRKFKTPQQFNDYGITKLFVFGDSYADTGNLHEMWIDEPYGISLNKDKPRGRYSDGLILTDYVAKFLGLKTPPSYHWRHNLKEELHYGMNFAYGGAGVFQTLLARPNVSAQIDLFENLIKNSEYTTYDLESSLFLVTLAGNDYVAFLAQGKGIWDLMDFYQDLLDTLSDDLERLSKLGAKRIAVGSLQPVGCLPHFTAPDYKVCNATGGILVQLHNDYLTTKLQELNTKRLTTSFIQLDLNSTFTNAIFNKKDVSGKLKFVDPLRPCCTGSCGDVDDKGKKLYEVCADPKTSFFWDSVHPTQSGWEAVFEALLPTFQNISSFIA